MFIHYRKFIFLSIVMPRDFIASFLSSRILSLLRLTTSIFSRGRLISFSIVHLLTHRITITRGRRACVTCVLCVPEHHLCNRPDVIDQISRVIADHRMRLIKVPDSTFIVRLFYQAVRGLRTNLEPSYMPAKQHHAIYISET